MYFHQNLTEPQVISAHIHFIKCWLHLTNHFHLLENFHCFLKGKKKADNIILILFMFFYLHFFFSFALFGLLYERISFQVLITENSRRHQIQLIFLRDEMYSKNKIYRAERSFKSFPMCEHTLEVLLSMHLPQRLWFGSSLSSTGFLKSVWLGRCDPWP